VTTRGDLDRHAKLLGARAYRAVALLFLLGLLLLLFDSIARTVLIGFVAVILAIAFNAVVVRIPLRRGFATAVVAVGTLASLAAAAWFGISVLAAQVRELVADMPSLLASMEEWQDWLQERTGLDLEIIGPHLQSAVQRIIGGVDGATLIAGTFGVLELFALTILVLIGAFFAVGEPNEGLLDPVLRAVPADRRDAFRRMFALLGERLSAWLWGTFIASLAVAVLSIVVFYLLGTPYPLLLGTLIGITNVVPLVGPWIGGAIAILVTLLHDPGLALWVALAVLGIQEVESNLIRPFVMKGVARLHPFPTLLALILFTSMFGVLGAVLSLPLLITIATMVEVLWVEETLGEGGTELAPVVGE
jgi:predicted PurR-regulated permease PerM